MKRRDWRQDEEGDLFIYFSFSMAAKEVVETSGYVMWVHIRYHTVPLLSLLCSLDVSIVGKADSVAPF